MRCGCVRWLELPVQRVSDFDAEEVADHSFHGELEPMLLELCNDVVHIAECRSNEEGRVVSQYITHSLKTISSVV